MDEVTTTVSGQEAPPWALFTTVHVLRFVFDVLTDLAFLPSLQVVAKRRRHFELFIGALQFVSATAFNFADALDVSLFLNARQWHEMTNILTISYGLFLCISLMGNRNENIDHLLRYAAFASVWIAQLRDNYWMVESKYTAMVVVFFVALPVLKLLAARQVPPYNRLNVVRGVLGLAIAAAFFYFSLFDELDPFRVYHGVAQLFVGVALYYLWQAVPKRWYKKQDEPLPSYAYSGFANPKP